MKTYIALGSNLNQPLVQIQQAISSLARLPHTQLLRVSPFYLNPPYGFQDQPNYINAVAELNTTLSPQALLSALQAIEQQQGRIRDKQQRFAPRTLDLDILLYGTLTIHEPNLTIPHYALTERNFFLYPLADLAPTLILPDGRTIQDLLLNLSPKGLTLLNSY